MDAVTTKGNMVTFQGIIFTVENYDDGLVELTSEEGDTCFAHPDELSLYSDYGTQIVDTFIGRTTLMLTLYGTILAILGYAAGALTATWGR